MAMGFITRNKSGTVVNGKNQILKSVPLNYMFKNSELQDICEFRNMLETQCAQIASTRASDEAINRMTSVIEEMKIKAKENDIEALTKLDQKFHFEIAASVNNPIISNTLAAVTDEYEHTAYLGYCLGEKIIDQSIEFHEQILDAIKKHDPELAHFRMQAHIKNIYWVLQNITLENS